jgi:hypothetical protein
MDSREHATKAQHSKPEQLLKPLFDADNAERPNKRLRTSTD